MFYAIIVSVDSLAKFLHLQTKERKVIRNLLISLFPEQSSILNQENLVFFVITYLIKQMKL